MKFSKRIIALFASIIMLFTVFTSAIPAYASEKIEPRMSFSAT